MDKIWDKNPSKSEVIGRCGGDENTEWPRRTDTKSNAKKPLLGVFSCPINGFKLDGKDGTDMGWIS